MPKRQHIKPVRPSAAIDALYRQRLEAFVAEMHNSLQHWLTAAWNAKPPEMAQDAESYRGTPSNVMQRVMRRLSQRWTQRIEDLAPKLAQHFAKAVWRRSDRALAKSLDEAGWTVKFQMTPAMNDVFSATIHENVSLIKSIASQHLAAVEQSVQRAVAQGGQVGELMKDLEQRYGISRRRASLIARDQNSKATALLQRARQTELGITQAIWVHSGAGKEPRKSHLEAGREKMVYNIADGVFDDGEHLRANGSGERCWPGTMINCRCFARPILPAQLTRIENRAAA